MPAGRISAKMSATMPRQAADSTNIFVVVPSASSEDHPARGAKSAKRLEVSGAFHSPYMAPVRAALAAVLRCVEVRMPSLAVYSNVTGLPYKDAEQIRALLERQLVDSVLWEQSVAHMRTHNPCAKYVETGPGVWPDPVPRRNSLSRAVPYRPPDAPPPAHTSTSPLS